MTDPLLQSDRSYDCPPEWEEGDASEAADTRLLEDIRESLIESGKYACFDVVFDEDDVNTFYADYPDERDGDEYADKVRAFSVDIFQFCKDKIQTKLNWS